MLRKNTYIAFVMLLLLSLAGCKKEDMSQENAISTSPATNVDEKAENVINTSFADEIISDTTTSLSVSAQEEYDDTAGGNSDSYVQIEITVSNNKYFYNNHEVTFDEFKELLTDADENTNVILYDELASSASFKQLTDYLDEKEVPYSIK